MLSTPQLVVGIIGGLFIGGYGEFAGWSLLRVAALCAGWILAVVWLWP